MKKNIVIFIATIIILFFSFCCFFKFHLVSDSYRIIYNSSEYMIKLKLIEGRIVQVIYFFILYICRIEIHSISEYMFLYKINLSISIFLLSLCICIVYNIFFSTLQLNTKKEKFLLYVIVLTIFINISVCEYMLFIENFIIILGLLFSIIATIIFYSNKKIYSIILIMLSSFCYQGVAQFFVIFSFINFLIKNYNVNKKKYICTIIEILLVYLLAQLINYCTCSIFNYYLPNLDPRLFNGIITNLDKVITQDNVTISIIYLFIVFFTIFINVNILYKRNFILHIINVFVLVILSIISFAIFLTNNSCGLMPRTLLNFIVIFPIIIIYILSVNKCININVHILLISLLFIGNILFIIKLQRFNIKSTKDNIYVVNQIIEIIEEYETKNNTKINNIMFYDDKKINYEYWNAYTTVYSTYNNPIYYGYWCDIYSINVLSGRDFNRIKDENVNKKIYNYFKSKNWNEVALNEQIIFKGNTVNICRF